METNNFISRNKKLIGFSFFYLITIAFLILFFTVFSGNTISDKRDSNNTSDEIFNKLTGESEILMGHLKQLEKLDKRYSALFIQSHVTPAMDSVDTEIAEQENIFNNILDSFNRVKVNHAGEVKVFENQLNDYFRETLESRRTIGNIRYALAAGNFDFDSSQKKWLKLNSELIAKDQQISNLEDSLKLNNTGATATDLTAEDRQLRSALSEQEKKIADLAKSNNLLKQNLKAANTSAKSTDPDKGNKQQLSGNSSEELNAEVQLAKISCNLTRADVRQIISNSKQRKDLLTEALNVLNTLAKSDDPEIQNKAKEKLNELYRISKTIRD